MHLKSLTLKGFKSFPDRTRLDFGPGVSVVVGPNGSGKSNVTDAILWAMGEQSPLAVRGSSMQDVIFGGGRGVQARSSAEVEIVLDNSDGTVDLPLSEISIVRRLDRSGEGEYRLAGARCRLVDVIEVLSDTGMGKETHSVISQGRVESIVTSKPRDRRLLIEEAAGLGKHRKRRRRAQLKLERTQENLDRALDVEREARTRLRPLKRQSEAAQLHERLERQMLEARLLLARESVRATREQLAQAEQTATQARAQRDAIERRLDAVAQRRADAESALAQRTERHDALARRAYDARSARERLQLRAEQASATAQTLRERAQRIEAELTTLERLAGYAPTGAERADAERAGAERVGTERAGTEHANADRRGGGGAGEDRIDALQEELDRLDAEREREIECELEGLERERVAAEERLARAREQRDAGAEQRRRAVERLEAARRDRIWSATWSEVRKLIVAGVERLLTIADSGARDAAVAELADQVERLASGAIEHAFGELGVLEEDRERAETQLRESERQLDEMAEAQRKAAWLVEQRRAAPEQGAAALRRAQLQGELAAERRQAERAAAERAERARRIERLRAQHAADERLAPRAERLAGALAQAGQAVERVLERSQELLRADRAEGERLASELRACAHEEAEIQGELRAQGETVTSAEVSAQRLRDQAAEAEQELRDVAARLELPKTSAGGESPAASTGREPIEASARRERPASGEDVEDVEDVWDVEDVQPLDEQERQSLAARLERLARRREQLGPVNPLAQEEYAEALAHVEELEARRSDLETALRELGAVIRETDRQIHETFHATFSAAARNFEELAGHVFPGGSGRLKLVKDEQLPPRVLGGRSAGEASEASEAGGDELAADLQAEAERDPEQEMLGVEIEITPAGKSARRLSLLSGGEKSMTALAFLFAVFLARPCPFYVLDEVEAALDDLNLDRFLALLRRYAERAQFVVITHQKRTMEAADWLYGVSMADNGVSKVLSRRLPPAAEPAQRVRPAA